MTEQELNNLENIIINLQEDMETVNDESSFNEILNKYIDISGESPLLNIILNFLKWRFNMKQQRNEFIKNAMAPRRAFIVSHGDSPKTLLTGENKVKFIKPLTTWMYLNKKISCRTTIIDLVPFGSETLTGRQIGLMRGFMGLYIFHRSSFETKSNTYFIGIGGLIRSMDLSPSFLSK